MKAAEAVRKMQFCLDTEVNLKAHADEVSILFKHPDELEHFIVFCRNSGMIYFNSVTDECRRSDGTKFDVRFEFLRFPATSWRIEAMSVLGGTAGLHEPLRNHDVPHVSFKCIDYMHYDHVVAVLEGARWPLQADYVNSYGAFSYFGAYPPYLKPRVNLRDRKAQLL